MEQQSKNRIPTKILVYFAGHFDGEGCITMRHRPNKGIQRLSISVTGNFKKTLEDYKHYFGGAVRSIPHSSKNKLLYEWYVGSFSDMYFFLSHLKPFLKEKREQANVALQYLKIRLRCRTNRNSLPRKISLLATETFTLLSQTKK